MFMSSLAHLGDFWNVPEALFNEIDAFTCTMYRRTRFNKVNDLRLQMIKERCSADESLNFSKDVDKIISIQKDARAKQP